MLGDSVSDVIDTIEMKVHVLYPQPSPKGCTIHMFRNIVFYDEKGFGDSRICDLQDIKQYLRTTTLVLL